MKNLRSLAAGLAVLLSLAGCASTDFVPVQSNQTVFEGAGGAVKRIGGIDFWLTGDPNRRYEILGVVYGKSEDGEDTLRSAVARAAKKQGGDAVIFRNASNRRTGSSEFAFFTWDDIEEREEYWVVRYR